MCRGRYEPIYEYIIYWVGHSLDPGVTVLGFPSKGGIYVLRNCFGVELNLLQHDQ